jgi:hypothetical protein
MVIQHLKELLIFCIPDDNEQIEWSLVIKLYCQRMERLQKRGPNGQ